MHRYALHIIFILTMRPFAATAGTDTGHPGSPNPVFSAAMGGNTRNGADSLLPVRNYIPDEDIALDLLGLLNSNETGNARTSRAEYRQAASYGASLLKVLARDRSLKTRHFGARLCNTLAGLSARLKLYPLSMRFYCKALEKNTLAAKTAITGAAVIEADLPQLTDSTHAAFLKNLEEPSIPVVADSILKTFDDGKTAVAYALMIHVRQPIRGRRKAYTHINNVGHMFVTLIKYNDDETYAARTYGFYPNKKALLWGTPLHPASASTFKDDALHDWDEAAGKFISADAYNRIIGALKQYDTLQYHLSHNNCTDFGLRIAALGGIHISDTRGSWPLGKGNNPANAGQSLLEGKYNNTDSSFAAPLLVLRKGSY